MMTDTDLRNSSFRNLFLKKGVHVTSIHCPYHTNFKLKSYFSVINLDFHLFVSTWTSNNWIIPEKVETGGFEDIFFWKKALQVLGLSIYPWKFWTKQSFNLGNSVKPLEIQQPKIKISGNSTWIFLSQLYEFLFFFFNWPQKLPHDIFSIPEPVIRCHDGQLWWCRGVQTYWIVPSK